MKILKRLGYYIGGFALGLILLAFFIKGSGVSVPSCDYGLDARTLKNIRSKQLVLAPDIDIDTTAVNRILREGDVSFRESEPRKEPCGIYVIHWEGENKPLKLTVENCSETAKILNVE